MDTILLVESDLALREQLIFVLQHQGFRVAGVSGADEAVAEIDTGSCDLIVMAESNHRCNGDELCIRIREISDAPIIVLGRDEQEAGGANFLEMGADAYLTSPLNLRELLARICSLLRRTRANVTEAKEGIA